MAKSKKSKKKWAELTPRQRTAIRAVGAAQLALLVSALIDMWRRPAEQVNGPRAVWNAASFVNFLGPVSYFVFGRKR